jgi:hypothetical protein
MLVPFHSCDIQVEVVDFRDAARGMDDHLRLKCAFLTRNSGADKQLTSFAFDFHHFGSELNVNSKPAGTLYNLIDELRVKEQEGARTTMQYGTPASTTQFSPFGIAADFADATKF